MTNGIKCGIIITVKERLNQMKKDKRERKMTPQQLQELLHMRSRGYVQKNGKAYTRKQKHKGREE